MRARAERPRPVAGASHPFAALAVAGLVCAAGPGAWAQSAAPADTPAASHELRAWLVRIHEAANRRNFQGTFVVTGGGVASSARIAHFCEGPNQFQRSESLDGQARHVFRHNDVVTTVWPAAKVAVIEQRDQLAQFPALLQAGGDGIAEFYNVQLKGAERVAGHDANLLLVTPRDRYRYGYRLWADRATGLLLRADVIGEHDDVLESSAFSDVAIGVKPQPDSVLQPMRRLEGYRVLRPVLVPTRLEAEGWSMSRAVPGFREVSCVKRPLEIDALADAAPAGPRVLQAIYSDGLTHVSIFIEPFEPRRHLRPMITAVGPTQTLMHRQGEWWVTILGDVPPATLKMFANALERSKR